MKCDSCQEKATVFFTQVAEGKLKKFVLCETCAEAKGITDPDGMLMADEILAGGQPGEGNEHLSSLPAIDSLAKCLNCGFTLTDLQKVGRLGCPDCYRTFAGEIARRLPSMHKGQVHAGYMPAGLAQQQALKAQLSDLKADLESAISEEDFEKAAKLRDQLQELESSKEKGVSAS